MRTKVEHNGKTIAFTEGRVVKLHCSENKMLSDLTITVEGDEAVPPNLQEKTATSNGEVTPDAGYDGLSKVMVDVPIPEPSLEELTATENREYSPSEGNDGFSKVTVNVPIPDGYVKPSGILSINANGLYDVSHYEKASVDTGIRSNHGSGDITTYTITKELYVQDQDSLSYGFVDAPSSMRSDDVVLVRLLYRQPDSAGNSYRVSGCDYKEVGNGTVQHGILSFVAAIYLLLYNPTENVHIYFYTGD